MKIFLLPRRIGVSDGIPVHNSGTLRIELEGETVDGITVGGRYYSVVDGKVAISTAGLEGVVAVTAHYRPRRRAFRCEDLFFAEDLIIPVAHLTPVEYIAMAAKAERTAAALAEKVKKLEAAVYGLPLFGKDEL